MKRRRGRIAELLATLIVIGMWVGIAVEVSQAMSTSAEQAATTVAAGRTTTVAKR
jgi:Flp pilus assembly protein TadG